MDKVSLSSLNNLFFSKTKNFRFINTLKILGLRGTIKSNWIRNSYEDEKLENDFLEIKINLYKNTKLTLHCLYFIFTIIQFFTNDDFEKKNYLLTNLLFSLFWVTSFVLYTLSKTLYSKKIFNLILSLIIIIIQGYSCIGNEHIFLTPCIQIRHVNVLFIFSMFEILLFFETNIFFSLLVLFFNILICILSIVLNNPSNLQNLNSNSNENPNYNGDKNNKYFDIVTCIFSITFIHIFKRKNTFFIRNIFLDRNLFKEQFIYYNGIIDNMIGYHFTIKNGSILNFNENLKKLIYHTYNLKKFENNEISGNSLMKKMRDKFGQSIFFENIKNTKSIYHDQNNKNSLRVSDTNIFNFNNMNPKFKNINKTLNSMNLNNINNKDHNQNENNEYNNNKSNQMISNVKNMNINIKNYNKNDINLVLSPVDANILIEDICKKKSHDNKMFSSFPKGKNISNFNANEMNDDKINNSRSKIPNQELNNSFKNLNEYNIKNIFLRNNIKNDNHLDMNKIDLTLKKENFENNKTRSNNNINISNLELLSFEKRNNKDDKLNNQKIRSSLGNRNNLTFQKTKKSIDMKINKIDFNNTNVKEDIKYEKNDNKENYFKIFSNNEKRRKTTNNENSFYTKNKSKNLEKNKTIIEEKKSIYENMQNEFSIFLNYSENYLNTLLPNFLEKNFIDFSCKNLFDYSQKIEKHLSYINLNGHQGINNYFKNNKFNLLGEFYREEEKKHFQIYFRKLPQHFAVDFLMYDLTEIRDSQVIDLNSQNKLFEDLVIEIKNPINIILGMISKLGNFCNLNNLNSLNLNSNNLVNTNNINIINNNVNNVNSNNCNLSPNENISETTNIDNEKTCLPYNKYSSANENYQSTLNNTNNITSYINNLNNINKSVFVNINSSYQEISINNNIKDNFFPHLENICNFIILYSENIIDFCNLNFSENKTKGLNDKLSYKYAETIRGSALSGKSNLNSVANTSQINNEKNKILGSGDESNNKSIDDLFKNDKNRITELKNEKINFREISEFCKNICSTMLIFQYKENYEKIKVFCEFEEAVEKKDIFSDNLKIKQILINFISNSLKYTNKGFVKIRSELIEKEKKIKISVIDTGIGINKKSLNILLSDNIDIRKINKINRINDILNNNELNLNNLSNRNLNSNNKKKLIENNIEENASKNSFRHETNNNKRIGLGIKICKYLVNVLNIDLSIKSEVGQGSEMSILFSYEDKKLNDKKYVFLDNNNIIKDDGTSNINNNSNNELNNIESNNNTSLIECKKHSSNKNKNNLINISNEEKDDEISLKKGNYKKIVCEYKNISLPEMALNNIFIKSEKHIDSFDSCEISNNNNNTNNAINDIIIKKKTTIDSKIKSISDKKNDVNNNSNSIDSTRKNNDDQNFNNIIFFNDQNSDIDSCNFNENDNENEIINRGLIRSSLVNSKSININKTLTNKSIIKNSLFKNENSRRSCDKEDQIDYNNIEMNPIKKLSSITGEDLTEENYINKKKIKSTKKKTVKNLDCISEINLGLVFTT